jgi:ubiquinone/menaquinone biosynthesis C-methylase UbiE
VDAAILPAAESQGGKPLSAPATPQSAPSDVERPAVAGGQTAPRRSVSVHEGYRLWAPSYDRDPNPLVALEERELSARLPDVRGKNVLDAGCGTGRWLRKLARAGARSAVGLDFSAAMLNEAARHTGIRHRLIHADCLALPLRSGSADLIVCSLTIGHVPNVDGLAREFSRVARQDADVFVTDMHPRAQILGWRCGFRSPQGSLEVETWIHLEEAIRQSFCCAGFTLVEMLDLHIGEPERPIFLRAGKHSTFEASCALPAVLLCHFRSIPPAKAD